MWWDERELWDASGMSRVRKSGNVREQRVRATRALRAECNIVRTGGAMRGLHARRQGDGTMHERSMRMQEHGGQLWAVSGLLVGVCVSIDMYE